LCKVILVTFAASNSPSECLVRWNVFLDKFRKHVRFKEELFSWLSSVEINLVYWAVGLIIGNPFVFRDQLCSEIKISAELVGKGILSVINSSGSVLGNSTFDFDSNYHFLSSNNSTFGRSFEVEYLA
jgi:hypothetical protein